MVLEQYISELLYRYNCVIVPGFGGFLTQLHPAEIRENTNTFYPPSKSISFNSQLGSNDGLLTKHVADCEKLDYNQASKDIDRQVRAWRGSLEAGEKLSLQNIGTFERTSAGKIRFEPQERTNYLTSSFGMAPFVALPVKREKMKKKVVALEKKAPLLVTPEKRKSYGLRPYLKYAAVFLLAISTAVTAYQWLQNQELGQEAVMQEVQQKVNHRIQEATFFDTAPLEMPSIDLKVTPISLNDSPRDIANTNSQRKRHNIIAGAYSVEANADKKLQELRNKGYEGIALGQNQNGLYLVAYSGYNNPKEALRELQIIRQEDSNDAWLLSDK